MKVKNGKILDCEVCKNPFYVQPHRLRKNKHHTCSKLCGAKLLSKLTSKKIKVNCANCNKEIQYKKSAFSKIKNKTCSRNCRGKLIETLYLGSNNPNNKYSTDQTFFDRIDSEEKAYLLGWIASDGHIRKNGIVISIHEKDKVLLSQLRDIINPKIKIKNRKSNMVALVINGKRLATSVAKLFNITPGKKAFIVEYPVIDSSLDKHFIRGVFDGDGHVCSPKGKKKSPRCGISGCSEKLIKQIYEKAKITPKLYQNINKLNKIEYKLEWMGNDCLDFLSWIYDNSKIYLHRKLDLYRDISVWVSGLSGGGNYGKLPHLKWNKSDTSAVPPSKVRASDSGYDVTIIKKVKDYTDNVTLYDTGIKVQPEFGWWLMLVGRSSLAKTGYSLATSMGIIDRSYIGTIHVALIKNDPNMPDIELPAKVCQLIPMPIVNFQVEEVDSFEPTNRGDGGFGSTGK